MQLAIQETGANFPLASHYVIRRPGLQPATQRWKKGFLVDFLLVTLAEGLVDQKFRIITGNSRVGEGIYSWV